MDIGGSFVHKVLEDKAVRWLGWLLVFWTPVLVLFWVILIVQWDRQLLPLDSLVAAARMVIAPGAIAKNYNPSEVRNKKTREK